MRLVRDYFWPMPAPPFAWSASVSATPTAGACLRWIKANGMAQVSREDIREHALSRRLDAEESQKLIDGLAKSGWFRELPQHLVLRAASQPAGGQ